jgi:hypothetical protein
VPLLVPGSVVEPPGGNFSVPTPALAATPKKKAKAAKCKRGFVRRRGRCIKQPKAKRASDKRSKR